MSRTTRRLFALLAFLSGIAPLRAASLLEGRFLDGEASTRLLRDLQAQGRSWQGLESSWHAALGAEEVRVDLAGAERPRSWTVKTDPEGRFSLDTGPDPLPAGARLVARLERAGVVLFSPSFDPRGADREIFLYPPTDSAREVIANLWLVHDLAPRGDETWIRVRVTLSLSGISSGLYVGRREGSLFREVFRIPLPAGAEITRNAGVLPGVKWKQSADGKWLVVDEPVPGLPDTLKPSRSAEGAADWEVEYLAPPRQHLTLRYALPVSCQRFTVYTLSDEMSLLSRHLQMTQSRIDPDAARRGTRASGRYDRFDSAEWLPPGGEMLLGLEVSNVAVGQVSRTALKWHGGFLLVSLVAILGGLLLGVLGRSAGASQDIALAGLGRDDLLDALVDLDRRRGEGRIPEQEYRDARAALVELLARGLADQETPEDGAAAGAGVPPPAFPPAAAGLLARLDVIEREGAATPQAVQERAHLLEALYRSLRQAPARGGARKEEDRAVRSDDEAKRPERGVEVPAAEPRDLSRDERDEEG